MLFLNVFNSVRKAISHILTKQITDKGVLGFLEEKLYLIVRWKFDLKTIVGNRIDDT